MTGEEPAVIELVRGSAEQFAALTERHRRELRVHCYRMLGSLDEAEDLVQETFARAWRGREGFEGRSTFRAWLYRIATNACLDAIKRSNRRVRTVELPLIDGEAPSLEALPWLQPMPDALLGATDGQPDAAVVARETVELAFLAAIQNLPPRQRAVVILIDILEWTPKQTAEALDGTVTAVNSALQRARATLRRLGRPDRVDWSPVHAPTVEETRLLQRYIDAHERADADAIIQMLGDDIRFTMPPQESFRGVAAVAAFFERLFGEENPGDWRLVATRANGQPAAANYVRMWGEQEYKAITIDVLRFEHDRLVGIATFGSDRFPAFGLPDTLPED